MKSQIPGWTGSTLLIWCVAMAGCQSGSGDFDSDIASEDGATYGEAGAPTGRNANIDGEATSEKQPPAAAEPGNATITHGPLLGQVQPTSAGIWLRTSKTANVAVHWADNAQFANSKSTAITRTALASDLTGKIWLRGLTADKTYWYRIVLNDTPQPGVWQFRTAPGSSTASFTMAVLTDFDAAAAPLLTAVNALKPSLVAFEGDLDHRNPGQAKGVILAPAAALTSMRAMHKELRGSGSLFGKDFHALMTARKGIQYPLLHVWDDHDYGMNNASIAFARRPQAIQAFNEYFIKASNEGSDPERGIWQKQAYGAADIFLLDLRSERDPNMAPNGLNGVPAAACDAMHGASRHTKTMLGPQQKQWFKDNLLASTRKWKIILSTVPFNPDCKAYDGWGAFPDERKEIVDFINNSSITGVIFVSGDIHSGGAIDDGTNSDFPEISTPWANVRDDFVDTWIHGTDPKCEQGNTCGNWSGGMFCGAPSGPGGPGLAYLEVREAKVVMSVRGKLGGIRKQLTVY